MGRLALLLVSVPSLWAQLPNLRPETTLLAEVREKMLNRLASQPDYTCLETVERTRQAPGGGAQVDDTLRLEVALVDGKEMFAWPGAKQFEDLDIRQLVSTGMFGNGNYAIYTRMLFSGSGPDFAYVGEALVEGTQTFQYDFRVRAPQSGYHLSVNGIDAITGFHGSLYLDPVKADLRRLEIFADDIPPELGLTSTEDRVDYAHIAIGEDEFLLPVQSTLRMAGKDSISQNHVRFSSCRKFTGESSLIFDDSDLVELNEAPVITEVELPPDVSLTLEISSDLRLDKAAVGDEVTAILRSDVKRGKEKVVAKGALAKGRVILLDRWTDSYTLGIQFHELEWKNGHAAIHAQFETLGGFALAGRPRILTMPDGTLRLPLSSRTLRGETLLYRTVR